MISPDRVPNPHMYEVGYFYQNIWTTAADLKAGELNVYNENFFRDLSAYALEWEVMKNGTVVRTGRVDNLNVAPQQTAKIKLDFGKTCACAEWLLNVRYVQKQREGLVPAGHIVAKDQLVLNEYKAPAMALQNVTDMNIQTALPRIDDANSQCVMIEGENFNIQFAKADGFMDKYMVGGLDMIKEGAKLTPNFWRAPTDNDFGAGLQQKYAVWKNPEFKLASLKSEMKDGLAVVSAEYEMPSVSAGTKLQLTYEINNRGAVKVNQKLVAEKGAKVANIFRFGMQMVMPKSFENISYYGRGPVENYIDRKWATELGVYNQTVTDQFYAYIRPQENGNKTDIRWWKLFNEAGSGLQFVAEAPFSASALHYTIESLDSGWEKKQEHSNEVEPADLTNFLIDKVQMGLGCVDSWGAIPREEYMLPYGDYEFTFIMQPINNSIVIE